MTLDKAKVESGVQVVERWIVAALRHRKCFSLAELNQAIRELLMRLNEWRFRKRDGSRASLFHTLDKPALAPLPSARFDMSQWERATVNIDYHVVCEGNFYHFFMGVLHLVGHAIPVNGFWEAELISTDFGIG